MGHLNKKLVWERVDGGISITHLDERDKLEGETDEAFITRYTERLKLNPLYGSSVLSVIEDKDIPKDRSERNEWSVKNGKVEVDQVKVKAKKDREDAAKEVLTKLGITKEELEKVVGPRV